MTEEGNVYGCGSVKGGKLGIVVGPNDPPFLAVPRLIGTKAPQFKKIVEIKANNFHSMAVSYDIIPSNLSSKDEATGGVLLTFGQDRMGVPFILPDSWTRQKRSEH